MTDKMQLTYVLAASHSGSTLLAMLLGAHPDACTVGEIKLTPKSIGDVEHYRCSCGQLIRQCEFWRAVSERLAAEGMDFDIANAGTDHRSVDTWYTHRLLKPLHRGTVLEFIRDAALALSPSWRRRYPQIQRKNAAIVRAAARIANGKVVVDSSKVALRLKYLLRNNELDVKVVRLVRDGRAVAMTYMDPASFADASDPSLRGGGSGGDRRAERMSMADAAYTWRRANEEAECALRRLDPSRVIRVRHEQVCTETDATLERVLTFLGLDPNRRVREFRAVANHVIGNGMRLDKTSEVRLDERWKSVLTETDLADFDAVAGNLNRRYGYE